MVYNLGMGRGKVLATLVDEQGRVCTKCMEYKTWDFFYKRKDHGNQHYQNECIPCFRRRVNPANAVNRRKIRQEALDHYGGCCTCCGETELVFLTIDHINNDGAEHRRQLGSKGGNSFYYWLRRNSYPDTFQILCWNCNAAKHINGICPHALARAELKEAV
jgi:hypothetical protein